MKIHVYQYFLLFCFLGLLSPVAGCSDTVEPSEPEQPIPPTPAEDEYTLLNVEYRKWQIGTFQGWETTDSQETRIIDNMNWYTSTSDFSRTAWGRRIGLQPSSIVGKSGFFRVANYQGRSYLLDPDDGAVIIHGIQHVRPETSVAHKESFNNKFGGSEARWSKETGKLIADNHINYISYGSNRIETFPSVMRNNLLTPKTQKIAYAECLCPLRSFQWDMYKNLGYSFDDDKYNRLVIIFEPTFAPYIDELCREKTALFAGDKHFIGYYLDNELPFASFHNGDPLRGIDLKQFLSLPDRYKTAREYADKFMNDKGITLSQITEEVQEEFRGLVADYYYRLSTEAIRRYDTEHLILGSRLHDWSKYNQKVVEACARHCDVVSINYYGRWQPENDFLTNLKIWCGTKPFLVSEFYTKAEDANYKGNKYDNTEGGGWLVRTQKNRGEFYQNFCLRLLETKNCIGWVHFEYNDGYNDGKSTNKGIVSLEYEPYDSYLSYMRQLNLAVYSLIDYYDNKQ
ncbi:hypothetical protein [uncultured Bacteroides sp.]|uniref:hypothetical protein n=1 Tax=uncultured Bacteroides sp. TaxID=162156 RepID=UPI0025D10A59|nr:hypothetical protein [uncultured Bacteroides sp.]